MTFEFWFMFPIAMSTGVGGAIFFSPIFLIALKLEPTVRSAPRSLRSSSDSVPG